MQQGGKGCGPVGRWRLGAGHWLEVLVPRALRLLWPALLVLPVLPTAALAALAAAPTATAGAAHVQARPAAPVQRCGWFENPTPGNAWLTDRDGQWLIGAQGGPQAEGDWPSFKPWRWVATNGHYGYGCACLRVVVNAADKTVLQILSASSRPLYVCQRDKALRHPESP